MILKITSGLSKKQKYTIIGLLIFTTLSLAISYLVNQTNKNSQAAIILPLTGGLASSSSTKQLSSINISSSSIVVSSSVLSSSSAMVSSSSETLKTAEEKPKEQLPPEKEQPKFTVPEPEVKITPPQKILLKPKAPEVVYEQPIIIPVIPEPKVEAPQPIVEKIVPVIETPKPSVSFSSNSCDQSLVYQLLDLVNNHRVANGSGRVTLAGDLNGVACSHATWMNETGTFSHTGKDGTNPYQRCERAGTVCWAENVAFDSELTAQNIFELYKNSPGHNKNMLNPEYTEIGLAFAGVYNAQEFR